MDLSKILNIMLSKILLTAWTCFFLAHCCPLVSRSGAMFLVFVWYDFDILKTYQTFKMSLFITCHNIISRNLNKTLPVEHNVFPQLED